ncbi:MAG: Crp/Fnr family transcriptional regulator [Deltaproteobacteria bacterium]|nr:Crp/Fnr family transcriptional regulator [Deltaproteobacteria bacterium]
MEVLQILRKVKLFQNLSLAEMELILKEGRLINTSKGKHLFYQGDEAKNLYVVLEGKLKLTQLSEEGNQIVLRILGAGEPMAAISFFENALFPATAVAVEKSTCIYWPHENFSSLMEKVPLLATGVIQVLISRIQELQDRFRELATDEVQQRIAKALVRLSEKVGQPYKQLGSKGPSFTRDKKMIRIDLPLTRQDIAEMTGTTAFTVSRLLTLWEKEKIIQTEKKKILICDLEQLQSLSKKNL